MQLPTRIILCEVGLRDGLQNESTIIDTQTKVELTNRLIESGFRVIEIGSFVHPKAVPQMADTDELFRLLQSPAGVELRALVANAKGVERAVACGCEKVKLNVSASRTHNLANLNKTPEESVSGFEDMTKMAQRAGVATSGSISMPFQSPWEGETPLEQVERIVEAYLRVGIDEISLSDTSGMAMPLQVYQTVESLQAKYPEVIWWLHFHNTRGMGIANMLAAMQAGITRFDTSIGGLGGCPFIPEASGNVSTEDSVHMLEEMGIDTGIGLTEVFEIGKKVQSLVGHDLDSYVLKAGSNQALLARTIRD